MLLNFLVNLYDEFRDADVVYQLFIFSQLILLNYIIFSGITEPWSWSEALATLFIVFLEFLMVVFFIKINAKGSQIEWPGAETIEVRRVYSFVISRGTLVICHIMMLYKIFFS